MTVQNFIDLTYDHSFPIIIRNRRDGQNLCEVDHMYDLNFWNGFTDTVKEAKVECWMIEKNVLVLNIFR